MEGIINSLLYMPVVFFNKMKITISKNNYERAHYEWGSVNDYKVQHYYFTTEGIQQSLDLLKVVLCYVRFQCQIYFDDLVTSHSCLPIYEPSYHQL